MSGGADGALKVAAFICFVIAAASFLGAVAMAVRANIKGAIGLLVFAAVWGGFGALTRVIARSEAGGGAVAEAAPAPDGSAASAPAEAGPEDEWWRERSDWAEGKIRQDVSTASGGWMVGAFVLLGLGVAGILAYRFAAWRPGAFGVLALAVGVLLLVVGVRARIRARKFGVSVVECRAMPARLGERFQATVQTGVPFQGQPQKPFRVRLTCTRRSTSGFGDEKRTRYDTLWKHEAIVAGTISSAGPTFQVALDLAIPEALPPSSPLGFEDRTYWTLAVGTETAGVDYAAEFEVPVVAPAARRAQAR